MIASILARLSGLHWEEFLRIFIDISIKGTLLCLIAAGFAFALRRSSAYLRNMIWVFALAGLFIIPVFSFMAPAWQLPVIPEPGSWSRSLHLSDELLLEKDPFVGPPVPSGTEDAGSRLAMEGKGAPFLPPAAWVFITWIAGAAVYLAWFLLSRTGLHGIKRSAVPAGDDWEKMLERLSREMGLARAVELRQSPSIKAAITTGIWRPVVIIPSGSGLWPDNRKRLVLSHELAHIKRWDGLIETLAIAATVAYWFNPVIWRAIKQLRIERERDCDNAVLGAGAKPSDYAELLMKIASDLGTSSGPAWSYVTISQGSNLKERLMSILDPKIDRKRGTRRSILLSGLIALVLIVPLSTSGLWNVNADEKSKKKEKQKQQELTDKEKKEKQMQEGMTDKEKKEAYKKKMQTSKKMMSPQEKADAAWEKLENSENSAAFLVGKTIKKEGMESGQKLYLKLKKKGEGKYYFKEAEFNSLGYIFLNYGKTDEAIGVFKMNVKAYPDSWNVYDSLGEAYLAGGELELAKKYYKRSIELNPKNERGMKMLEKIKQKESAES